ncbi:MAG: type II toxin-antitoxin system VapC family toxin [Ignavibacteriae bacterium]|nr:type II toxin-antitoxin system VapC family toxin [Ignavibacteriota bacterium]
MLGRTIYWDASTFLSWLKNEPRKAGIQEGIEQHVRLIDEGKIALVTSVLSLAEVLDAGEDDHTITQFYSLFDRPNVVPISVDFVVAKLAGDIRKHYKSKKNIRTPDAIHLASALHYRANEFHTLDEGLLNLHNDVAGHKLLICEPYSSELSFLNQHEEDIEKDKPEEGNKEI